MLKRLLLGALTALCFVSQVFAQSSVQPYYTNSSGTKTPVGTGNPLPVTSSPSASVLTSTSTALSANRVIKASSGSLWSFEVSADSTLSAAAWWVMIYDSTSAPADGPVTPKKCYALASGTTSYAAAFPAAVPFSSGIVVGVSTNGCFTKAESTHAFISADYQ